MNVPSNITISEYRPDNSTPQRERKSEVVTITLHETREEGFGDGMGLVNIRLTYGEFGEPKGKVNLKVSARSWDGDPLWFSEVLQFAHTIAQYEYALMERRRRLWQGE